MDNNILYWLFIFIITLNYFYCKFLELNYLDYYFFKYLFYLF